MRGAHWHTGAEFVIVTGAAALLFLNLWRFSAAFLAQRDNPVVASIGRSAGALITFGA